MERGEALIRLGDRGRRGPSAHSECCFSFIYLFVIYFFLFYF